MWWLVLFLCAFVIVTYWNRGHRETMEQPQTSAEVIAQLEMNSAAVDELTAKIKTLQASSKRIDEVENKINSTVDMLKSINEQCSKTE